MKQKNAKMRINKIINRSQNFILIVNEITDLCQKYKLPLLSFKEKMQLAQKNLDLICITEDQKAIIEELSHEMAKMIHFDEFIIKKNFYHTIKEWQKINNCSILSITQTNKSEQIKIGTELLNLVIKKLATLMYFPNYTLKKKFINHFFEKSCEIYKELLIALNIVTNPANEEIILELQIDNWLEEINQIFEKNE